MTDVLTPKQRKLVMSRIRAKNTKPEMTLRRALWAGSLRYRLHVKLPGRPDICFLRQRVAVFVDGCFWHGCPLHGNIPATNVEFWKNKLEGNAARDQKVNMALETGGWTVLRFWEHEVEGALEECIKVIRNALKAADEKRRAE